MTSYSKAYKDIFGEDFKKESYKLINHSFEFNSRIGKSVCKSCGLIYLKNEFSEWSVRMGCMSSDHSSYESKRKIGALR